MRSLLCVVTVVCLAASSVDASGSSASSSAASTAAASSIATGPSTVSTTPRISMWSGKVNQHNDQGTWKTDPDGSSGADLDKLGYCKKWWSSTTSVKLLPTQETITFYTAGNAVAYVSTKDVYECVGANTSTAAASTSATATSAAPAAASSSLSTDAALSSTAPTTPAPAVYESYTLYPMPANDDGAPITQSQAADLCQERGAYMATITSLRQQRLVNEAAVSSGSWSRGSFMLGGSQEVKAGTYVWKYGPPNVVEKTIWANGECMQEFCNWNTDYTKSGRGNGDVLYSGWHGAQDGRWHDKPDAATDAWNTHYMCQANCGSECVDPILTLPPTPDPDATPTTTPTAGASAVALTSTLTILGAVLLF